MWFLIAHKLFDTTAVLFNFLVLFRCFCALYWQIFQAILAVVVVAILWHKLCCLFSSGVQQQQQCESFSFVTTYNCLVQFRVFDCKSYFPVKTTFYLNFNTMVEVKPIDVSCSSQDPVSPLMKVVVA